jgi:hypothetical protein
MKLFNQIKLLPLYFVYIFTFGLAAADKFFGGVPPWFIKQFESTALNLFPGSLGILFYSLAILETATTIFFLVSLGRREFLNERKMPLLNAAFVLSLITFAMLGFGQRISHDFSGAFQLFAFFVLTFLVQRKLMPS